MSRFETYNALTLHTREFGEANREATFLTADAGLIRAVVYGGPKSKLRAYVSPFHTGRLYIYHEPVRDSRTVRDFDVARWREGVRASYERVMSAGAIAETIIASAGGGCEWPAAFDAAEQTLDALCVADADTARRLAVQFLWRWADLLGCRPPEVGLLAFGVDSSEAFGWLRLADMTSPEALGFCVVDDGVLGAARTLCLRVLAAALGKWLDSWRYI